jgi:hypothetical protein
MLLAGSRLIADHSQEKFHQAKQQNKQLFAPKITIHAVFNELAN